MSEEDSVSSQSQIIEEKSFDIITDKEKEMKNIMDEESNKHYENIFVNVPLDELDGAMRVLHPIIEGIKNKNYLSIILLRNYTKSNW